MKKPRNLLTIVFGLSNINFEIHCGHKRIRKCLYLCVTVKIMHRTYPVTKVTKRPSRQEPGVTGKGFIHVCCVTFYLQKCRLEVLTVCTLFSWSVGRVLQAKMTSHVQIMRMTQTITMATTIQTSPLTL